MKYSVFVNKKAVFIVESSQINRANQNHVSVFRHIRSLLTHYDITAQLNIDSDLYILT